MGIVVFTRLGDLLQAGPVPLTLAYYCVCNNGGGECPGSLPGTDSLLCWPSC